VEERRVVSIRDLSSQGAGVGRDEEGCTAFVAYTAPGDVVEARITSKQARYWEGEVVSVREASAVREEARCVLFGRCGGCDWQHLRYEAQLEAKQRILRESLRRVGKQEIPTLPMIQAPPSPWGMRDRARLHLDAQGRIGFYERGSQRVLPFSSCPVLSPTLQSLLPSLQREIQRFLLPLTEIRLLTAEESEGSRESEGVEEGRGVEEGGSKGASILLSCHLGKEALRWTQERRDAVKAEFIQSFAGWVAAIPAVVGASLWAGATLWQSCGRAYVEVGEGRTRYRAEGFAQASFAGNRLLQERMLSMLSPLAHEKILEIYAGSGNLSYPLALRCAHLMALEGYPQAVEDAKAALASQEALQDRLSFVCFDDERDDLLALCRERSFRPDALLLDPPRRGLSKAIRQQILTLRPPRILYISCDPATLARDLQAFTERGYRLDELQAVDLMPHTAHLEALALLRWGAS
jgi:23S rRNA (uracil1939-C5)-methyltransferase